MTLKMVVMKYSSDIVIRAFGYYATSQTLYDRLRNDFQLPSLATLGRMTSKVSKLNKKIFCHQYLILLIPIKKGA